MITKDNFFRTSDDVMIYYEDLGEGESIILVPGFLCTANFFNPIKEQLAQRYRLIIMDKRCHGNSAKTFQNITIPRIGQDIYELMEHLKLEKVSLFGWSMASSAVLDMVERQGTDKIRRLGILDSALYPLGMFEENQHPLRHFNYDKQHKTFRTILYHFQDYCDSFVRIIFKQPQREETYSYYREEMMKIPADMAVALYSDFLHRDYVKTLPQLDVPTLIVGADSPVMPEGRKQAEYYERFLTAPHMLYLFENSGHVMFIEEPELTIEVINQFMENY